MTCAFHALKEKRDSPPVRIFYDLPRLTKALGNQFLLSRVRNCTPRIGALGAIGYDLLNSGFVDFLPSDKKLKEVHVEKRATTPHDICVSRGSRGQGGGADAQPRENLV